MKKHVAVPISVPPVVMDLDDLAELVQNLEFEFPSTERRVSIKARFGETYIEAQDMREILDAEPQLPDAMEYARIVITDSKDDEPPDWVYDGRHAMFVGSNTGSEATTIRVGLSRDGNYANVSSLNAAWAKSKSDSLRSWLKNKRPWYGYFHLRLLLQILHGIALVALTITSAWCLYRLIVVPAAWNHLQLCLVYFGLLILLVCAMVFSAYYRFLPNFVLHVRRVERPFSARNIMNVIKNLLAIWGLLNLVATLIGKLTTH